MKGREGRDIVLRPDVLPAAGLTYVVGCQESAKHEAYPRVRSSEDLPPSPPPPLC